MFRYHEKGKKYGKPVRGLGKMSLGACRALEVCTFARKECTGANEPGFEGESSTKTREVARGPVDREYITHW